MQRRREARELGVTHGIVDIEQPAQAQHREDDGARREQHEDEQRHLAHSHLDARCLPQEPAAQRLEQQQAEQRANGQDEPGGRHGEQRDGRHRRGD